MLTKKAQRTQTLKSHTHLAYVISIVIMSVFLASCTIFWPEESPPPPPLTTHAQVEKAADSIDHSLISLYEVERYKKPENMSVKADPNPAPIHPSLSREMEVDWSGPTEPLLKEVAMLTNYRLKVIGHEPAIPVLVTVRHKKISAHELIREVRAQAYQRADILVFPDSGVIELHYIDV